MSPAPIVVRGARTHNLRSVDLDITPGSLVAFCGVSGSGKSSFALDTLHHEGQRRMLDALGAGGRLPPAPVDLITGLPPSIAVPARPPGRRDEDVGARSGCGALLRGLVARHGVLRCPHCGEAHPHRTPDAVLATLRALPDGTRLTLMAPLGRGRTEPLPPVLAEMRREGFARVRLDGAVLSIDDVPPVRGPWDLDLVVDRLKTGPERGSRLSESVQVALTAGRGRLLAMEGRGGPVHALGTQPWCPDHDTVWPVPTPARLDRRRALGVCEACEGAGEADAQPCAPCGGSGLSAPGRHMELCGAPLPFLLARPLVELQAWLSAQALPTASAPARADLDRRLSGLAALGLGHLPLAHTTDALSTSERHRLWVAARTETELSGVVFVLDEPTDHLGEVSAVVERLRALRDAGNTVLVVDHHPDVLRAADRVVEFGPGPGREGGRIVADGAPDAIASADTPTGRLLSGALPSLPPIGKAEAEGLRLPGDALFAPWRAITAVTGPPGCGKSRLVEGRLVDAARRRMAGEAGALEGELRRVVVLERRAGRVSPRSCVATLSGLWDPLRTLLAATREARVLGFGPERFSFNRPEGRCPACEGTGRTAISLGPMPAAHVPCAACDGARFSAATLEVRWRGRTAAQLLDSTIAEVQPLFQAQRGPRRVLDALVATGLGYLTLGQRSDALSGGEHQRLQLAATLARATSGRATDSERGTLLVADAPAAGLHAADVPNVMRPLQELASRGAAVVLVAYDPAVLAAADRVHTLTAAP
jgi:excinuclease ABC subunit A